jgi:hypothetical protein
MILYFVVATHFIIRNVFKLLARFEKRPKRRNSEDFKDQRTTLIMIYDHFGTESH